MWYHCNQKQHYTQKEAANIAANEQGVTLLRTNRGKLYRNTYLHHAMEVFVLDTQDPESIIKIWIKESPCQRCCKRIVKLYRDCPIKPLLYIGLINSDKEGLKVLVRNGFKLKVWTKLHERLFEDNNVMKRYLRKIRQDVHKEVKTTCNIS